MFKYISLPRHNVSWVNPIISWNKTDTGAFFTMISRIFTEYDKNCFTFKVIHIVLLKKNLFEMAVYIYIYIFQFFFLRA